MFERHANNLDVAVQATASDYICTMQPSSSAVNSVLLTDFYVSLLVLVTHIAEHLLHPFCQFLPMGIKASIRYGVLLEGGTLVVGLYGALALIVQLDGSRLGQVDTRGHLGREPMEGEVVEDRGYVLCPKPSSPLYLSNDTW